MSGEALGWAKRQTAPTRGCKALLICLADYASKEGFAWPSLASMEEETQMARRHISRSLVLLCRAGLLQAYEVHDASSGRSRPRLYWFPIRGSEPDARMLETWRIQWGARLRRVDPFAEGEGRGHRFRDGREDDTMSSSPHDSRVMGEDDSRVMGRMTPESSLEPLPEPQRSEDLFQSARAVERDVFAEALAAYPASGAGVTDESKAREAWASALGEAGSEDRLLGAVLAYAADPSLKKRDFGAPSMQRWLGEGRWRRWLPETSEAVRLGGPVAAGAWAGPPEIRAALVESLGEGAAVSYLDPSGWDAERGVILARTSIAADRLQREARAVLAVAQVTVEVSPRPRSTP